MLLTAEQKKIVDTAETAMVSACPGSGKTRVIISKILKEIDHLRGTPRRIACITYTNAAVHEIEDRLHINLQPGDDQYFDVCTIHSFCLNHIFRPFCHLVRGYKSRFRVITMESDDFENIVKAVCAHFDKFRLGYRDYEEFSQIRVSSDGRPVGNSIDSGSITIPMALAYWNAIRAKGYIDFSNIIYHSLVLLRSQPQILDYVAARFAWILIDEFQDTTDLQVEIVRLIAAKFRTKLLLVGDPNQSIFRFAGAEPHLAGRLSAEIKADESLGLSGNFRSSAHIVDLAERVIPRSPPMKALGKYKDFKAEPIWVSGSSPFQVITEYFLPALDDLGISLGNSAVLAPAWFSLFPLGRKLRDFGVPIVGPGARPYRRNRFFAPLAETMCGYLMEPSGALVAALERTLFHVIQDLTGRTHFEIFSYRGRTIVFELIAIAKHLKAAEPAAVRWLERAAGDVSNVLIREEFLTIAEKNLLAVSVEEMKNDMRINKIDTSNLSTEDLGIYASSNAALKLSTLHNAKGREFDGVAMIDLHEGRIPSFYARSADDFDEQERLFYVGITRAKRFLLLITDRQDLRNRPSRFIAKCDLPAQ